MTPNPTTDRRSFLGASAAVAMAGLAGCAATRQVADGSGPEGAPDWPDPKEGQREVMLLGTIHLAQSPGDTPNAYAVDPGDVLGTKRQRELETLTDRLAEWDPDRVAVEHVASEQSSLDRAFEAYADDGRNLDDVSDWDRDRSNETVQIGFRLADKLGHDSVAAVDYFQSPAALLTEEERSRMPKSLREFIVGPDEVAYPLPDITEAIAEEQRRLDEGSLLEFYRYLNRLDVGANAWHNDQLFYASAFERSDHAEYTAVKVMTAWTQRNLRIASNLWNAPDADDERVLVVYGASHVPQLGQILTGTPMMAPVSPLSYLDAG